MLLSTVYRVLDANTEYLNNIDDLFQNCLTLYTDSDIIIVGDFNLDISKTSNSKKINGFARSCSLHQLDFTRVTDRTKTIIDLAFVTRPETISESGVHSLWSFLYGLSDHSLIYLVKKHKQTKLPPRVMKSRSYNKFNALEFLNTVNNKNWGKVTTYNNVNEAWSCWVTMFNDACNKHAPIKQKRMKGFLPEWVTSVFLQLSKDRDYCYAKAHRTNNVQDWAKAKAQRNKANNLNKSLKSEFFQKEIKNNE